MSHAWFDRGALDKDAVDAFLQAPTLDNYRLNWSQFPILCQRAGFLPLLDMCCDVLGSNSMCPFFYSAAEDARKQQYDGMPVWCNPPFKDQTSFMRPLEVARARDSTTQAILIIPRTFPFLMKPLYVANLWRRVQYWHRQARYVFLQPAADSILGCNRRPMASTVQTILALALGPSTREPLEQQVRRDMEAEKGGQIRSSDVSCSEPEPWHDGAKSAAIARPHKQKWSPVAQDLGAGDWSGL